MGLAPLFRTLGPILGGVAAGVTIVCLAGNHGPPARAQAPSTVGTPATPPPLVERPADPYLERRIAELESRLARLSAGAANQSPPPAAPAIDIPGERETATQREIDGHQKLLEQHAVEARDRAWAASEERDVSAKLRALSDAMDRAFSVQSVDCRTSTCVAQLEWPSEGAAKAHLRSLLSGSSDVQCARQIAFPPADGNGAYAAALYLDCAEVRWGAGAADRQ